ncbi:cbb3-type cytochrome oxidase assembly protein CcoS [Brevundimonas sp.]|uniref:cbb3-type cytochrome oxidase assembly protein CcoS n=1 Tax=Brevundimonas sp. TaxID=1871086 RepID=UPI002ED99CC8
MNIIFLLAPFSVLLGLMAVGAFVWTLRSGQYEDIEGSAARILIDEEGESDRPAPGLEAAATSAPAGAEGPHRG